jgi:hypothetical protein
LIASTESGAQTRSLIGMSGRVEVARIAAAHGLDVEDGLASILPAMDAD